uniref:Large ribosomal subunit protein uL23 n=1 Tax=Candidatus Aschnera chinzeii TaxID=1485666 RepID=A0AAT9G492_9ENTR|nr:MAG: 50S ribosomal protein L23 [Candidatus Aschnera chinzeii]
MNSYINNNERLFKILQGIHISEKTSTAIKKNNTITLKVIKNATKLEIKQAVQQLFSVEITKITTLINKKKNKRRGKNTTFTKSWKKAFITLKKGQNLPIINAHK